MIKLPAHSLACSFAYPPVIFTFHLTALNQIQAEIMVVVIIVAIATSCKSLDQPVVARVCNTRQSKTNRKNNCRWKSGGQLHDDDDDDDIDCNDSAHP